MSAATLARATNEGYTLVLEEGRLKVRGDAPPSPELRQEMMENRDGLKAALLLAEAPAWLAKMVNLHKSGETFRVWRTLPPKPQASRGQESLDLGEDDVLPEALPYPDNLKGGKRVACDVTVSVKNIAAAVAATIGISPTRWECIRPEVEEALR